MRALSAIRSSVWAILPEHLELMEALASREDPETIGQLEALQSRVGRPLGNSWRVTHRDGVAIVPVVGPIFSRADFFTRISGATDTGTMAREFTAALESEETHAIILEVDSPGGEAARVGELAGMIRAARGKKPIVAYVSDLGCSGAYWIASAADRIVAAPSATLGSIGVVMTYTDTSEAMKRRGVTTRQWVSSRAPRKRPDLDSEAGRLQVQEQVDAIEDVFIRDVAANRGIDPEQVAERYGQGGVFVGEHAVKAGLADSLGTLEGLIAEFPRPEPEPPRLWGFGGVLPGAAPAGRISGSGEPQRTAAEEREPMSGENTQAQEGFWEKAFRMVTGGGPAAQAIPLAAMVGAAQADSGESRELRAERDQAVARVAELEGELKAVCTHFREQIAKSCVQLGTPESAREAAGADALVEAGKWRELAADAGPLQSRVFATIPAGTSADPKTATAGGEQKPNYREEGKSVALRFRGKSVAANGEGK